MTDDERIIQAGRVSYELERQFGARAHLEARKRLELALAEGDAEGDAEEAEFWEWVWAALRPRSEGD